MVFFPMGQYKSAPERFIIYYFNRSNFLSLGVIHSLISLNKSCDYKASDIDIFTNKLDDSDNTNTLRVFYSFWFWISLVIKHT